MFGLLYKYKYVYGIYILWHDTWFEQAVYPSVLDAVISYVCVCGCVCVCMSVGVRAWYDRLRSHV